MNQNIFYQKLSILLSNNIEFSKALTLLSPQYPRQVALLQEALQTNTFNKVDPIFIHLAQKHTEALHQWLSIKNMIDIKFHKLSFLYFYPAIVLSIISLLFFLINLYVLPNFKAIYQSFDAELPWLTSKVIELSDFTNYYGLVILFIAIMFIILLRQSFIQPWIPILNIVFKQKIALYFTKTMALLYQQGFSSDQALQFIKDSFKNQGNIFASQKIQHLKNKLEKGENFYQAMQNTQLFPPMALALIETSEYINNKAIIWKKLAEYYDLQTQNLHNIEYIIEVIMLLILGVIVGSLVIAVYLPIFSLGSLI